MLIVEDRLIWSASDFTRAAECEYAVLRTLDYKLGRIDAPEDSGDPFLEHIAALGDRHEATLLSEFQARGTVATLRRLEVAHTAENLTACAQETVEAFASDADRIFQAAFFDGEFFGYADFIERTSDGWLVCDAKLALSAKPAALLQLAAYAEQIEAIGQPLAPEAVLLLGSGERASFPLDEIRPVFRERRERFRTIIGAHRDESSIVWGDDRYVACGSCAECARAAEEAHDLVLVAKLRMEQRSKFRGSGITTVQDLAQAAAPPPEMAVATFENLRAQARMQWQQMSAGDGEVRYELTSEAHRTLWRLPEPSPGDWFFDFEGDPLHEHGGGAQPGLEYLWGVTDAQGDYKATWAHSAGEERDAFVSFVDALVAQLTAYPAMHVYHYAPYETTALKRLAMRYQVREEVLDDLLRADVFIDLYATVSGAIRISQSSYSIKKLEPLYMGEQLREGDVADGAGSIVAYAQFCVMDDPKSAEAQELLQSLADYNEYDCLSTLRLRDWLLERRDETERPDLADTESEDRSPKPEDPDATFDDLMRLCGDALPADRSEQERACAMLACALGYFRREDKQFWWEHFARLKSPISEWRDTRDVFKVESVQVESDWSPPQGRGVNWRRTLLLTGAWAPGSSAEGQWNSVYEQPGPAHCFGSERDCYVAGRTESVEVIDERRARLVEGVAPGGEFAATPVGLVPDGPPRTQKLQEAVREVAKRVAADPDEPAGAAVDLLLRRPPRMTGDGPLTRGGDDIADITSSLLGMADSYVAVQGPPGTGKTYVGARVIKRLVEERGWRIGVVAQSHAVVENLLRAIVKAGLDPDSVAKHKTRDEASTWTDVKTDPKIRSFLEDHVHSGCVIGGTSWDFTNANRIERGELDLLVIDEAGQFTMANTIAVSVAADRLLLLGDPQQLPQVSQGSHAEPVDESALGWLLDGHHTMPEELGYFLAESYRMHPALSGKVSRLSYAGRLHSAAPASQRELEGVEPGLRVIELDHTGNSTLSTEEAAEIVEQVRTLQGTVWRDPDDPDAPRPLGPEDFLVVAPYNAQVVTIRRYLAEAGLADVRVGTVDKFQGQEAPVVLVSMVASSHGDVPRGMGFLLSRNRVNVAISRAQWAAILIKSRALTSYMPSTADNLLELGAFVALCESPDPADVIELAK